MIRGINPNWHQILQVTVIFSAAVLVVAEIGDYFDRRAAEQDNAGEEQVVRNERSTPRSFILPATPGVAFRQEREREEAKQLNEMIGCMPRLKASGIEFEGLPVASNLAFKEAVAKFQSQNALPVTGRVDEFTEEALRCRN